MGERMQLHYTSDGCCLLHLVSSTIGSIIEGSQAPMGTSKLQLSQTFAVIKEQVSKDCLFLLFYILTYFGVAKIQGHCFFLPWFSWAGPLEIFVLGSCCAVYSFPTHSGSKLGKNTNWEQISRTKDMKHLNIRLCSDALYWTLVAQSVMYKSFLWFLDLIFNSTESTQANFVNA